VLKNSLLTTQHRNLDHFSTQSPLSSQICNPCIQTCEHFMYSPSVVHFSHWQIAVSCKSLTMEPLKWILHPTSTSLTSF